MRDTADNLAACSSRELYLEVLLERKFKRS